MEAFIDFIKSFIHLFRFWIVLDPDEKGVQIRAGKFRKVLEPGWHFMLPGGWDKARVDDVTPSTLDLGLQDVESKDGKQVTLTAILLWQITDIKKIKLEVQDAEDALTDSASGYITEMIQSHNWDEIRKPDFPRKLKPEIQKQAREWGIRVRKVQFNSCTAAKHIRLIQDTPDGGEE